MVMWWKNVFKRHLNLQFSWSAKSYWEHFSKWDHLARSSTKTTKRIEFELFTNISIGLLHKRVSMLFLQEFSIFHYNTFTRMESAFCTKTIKSKLFKKHSKRRKSWASFGLRLGSLFFTVRINENITILLVLELIKSEKTVSCLTCTLVFPILGQREKVHNFYHKTLALIFKNYANTLTYL